MEDTFEKETDCEFTCNLFEDEEESRIVFTRFTNFEVDGDYGSDSDGRRGEAKTFIESDEADYVTVDGIALKVLPPKLRNRVINRIDQWMSNHEPSQD